MTAGARSEACQPGRGAGDDAGDLADRIGQLGQGGDAVHPQLPVMPEGIVAVPVVGNGQVEIILALLTASRIFGEVSADKIWIAVAAVIEDKAGLRALAGQFDAIAQLRRAHTQIEA